MIQKFIDGSLEKNVFLIKKKVYFAVKVHDILI